MNIIRRIRKAVDSDKEVLAKINGKVVKPDTTQKRKKLKEVST